jgi:hypothetical protein
MAWACACANGYYCESGCHVPHSAHQCVAITAAPTPAPTAAPTPAPTPEPTPSPTKAPGIFVKCNPTVDIDINQNGGLATGRLTTPGGLGSSTEQENCTTFLWQDIPTGIDLTGGDEYPNQDEKTWVTYQDEGARCYIKFYDGMHIYGDNDELDVSSQVVVSGDVVNPKKPGDYFIDYTCQPENVVADFLNQTAP